MRRVTFLLAACLIAWLGAMPARADDKVVFGLDWKAEAEYGGYYQALATGIYARHGLDVTIREGGPLINHMQLLMAGRLDFNLGGGRAIEFASENLPFMAVAAIFQKDLAVLIAHPGVGNDSFAALKGKSIMIGADTRNGWWRFLAGKYGYNDSQVRPYTFNLAPFLADKNAIQQGYISSEPYLIKQKTGIEPVVLPISEAGYLGYGNIITTSDKLVKENPGLVQRFIDASIEGWYSYLYGDPAPANKLIMQANPDMPADLIDFGRKTMIQRGTVDSGDAKTMGIGAMTDARWKAFYDSMVAVGVYKPGVDISKAYTTRFVDKRVGMDVKY
ncbi:MAG TPA: ABC transporter substrate-binding protein [Acetobacteraceae bacterium]|jgi:NitT/TauT family transport system substrate-binding protein|nr:ABC transporter substrate-binding protein [Acetobacteraceae bacterium]